MNLAQAKKPILDHSAQPSHADYVRLAKSQYLPVRFKKTSVSRDLRHCVSYWLQSAVSKQVLVCVVLKMHTKVIGSQPSHFPPEEQVAILASNNLAAMNRALLARIYISADVGHACLIITRRSQLPRWPCFIQAATGERYSFHDPQDPRACPCVRWSGGSGGCYRSLARCYGAACCISLLARWPR
jgi:hypothetical protein